MPRKYGNRNENAEWVYDVRRGYEDVGSSICTVLGPRADVNNGRTGIMTCTDDKCCAEEHRDGKKCEKDEITVVEPKMGKQGNEVVTSNMMVNAHVV